MTAIAERRRRRTVAAAVAAGVLTIVAIVLVAVGLTTLYNSRAGEAVGVDERPRVVLPSTPNALVAVTDDDGALASVVVLTLLPEGQGGSIVVVPVNADATAGFGVQRRPLDELFDPADPEAFVTAVEDMLAITIEQSAIVDPAGLEALLEPIGRVQVVLPDAVVDSDAVDAGVAGASGDTVPDDTVPDDTDLDDTVPADADPDEPVPTTTDPQDTAAGGSVPGDELPEDQLGVDGLIVTAGPQILETPAIVDVLTAIDESVPAADQYPIDVAMWTALAETAPVNGSVPVTTDPAGLPVPPASVEALLTALFDGEVGVRDIAFDDPSAGTNPTDADVVVLDRTDTTLIFAQISPSLVSTPNTGSRMRIVGQFSDEQLATTDGLYESNADLARELIGRLLFLQANVVSVDTTPSGAPDRTVVEVADPRLLEESIRAAEILFGPSDVVVAETVVEGVDIVVTLGASYLQREVETDTGDAGLEPDGSIPPATVGTDG